MHVYVYVHMLACFYVWAGVCVCVCDYGSFIFILTTVVAMFLVYLGKHATAREITCMVTRHLRFCRRPGLCLMPPAFHRTFLLFMEYLCDDTWVQVYSETG